MDNDPNDRFDRLLDAMANGPHPSARTRKAADPASGEAPDACSSDTHAPRDTSEDASR